MKNLSKMTMVFTLVASASVVRAAEEAPAAPPTPYVPVSMIDSDVRNLPILRNNAYLQVTLNKNVTQEVGENAIIFQNGGVTKDAKGDQDYCYLQTKTAEFVTDFRSGRKAEFHKAEMDSGYASYSGPHWVKTRINIYGVDRTFTGLICKTFRVGADPEPLTLADLERIMGKDITLRAAVVRVVGSKPRGDELIAIDPEAHSHLN